jgi:predicted nucleic acid-binding Zn ribbon protein
MSDDDLSINAKNRHQYYKTQMHSTSTADKNIMAAEARGRQRLAREEKIKRKVTIAFRVTLVLVLLAVVVWLASRLLA